MPNDDLAPGSGSGPTGRVTCEFCKCGLAADGSVLRRSERAKALMELDDDIVKVRRELDTAKAALTEAERSLLAVKKELESRPATVPAGSGDDW